MDYAELVSTIQDTVETTFETSEVDTFIRQAELLIYQSIGFPALNKTATGVLTSGNQYLALPNDFVYVSALAVIVNSQYQFLLPKDQNFIREAYPNASTTGVPQHYALFNSTYLVVGPTPGSGYPVELQYAAYPESIVDAGTSWLGDTFSPVLLNGSLVQAARFLKLEEDVIANYDKLYLQAIKLAKNFGDGRLRQDTYRNGAPRTPVS